MEFQREYLPMTEKLKAAPVAYQNEPFLNSPDGRILRILAEYQEPLARFRREQIQDTVVFFGSARFQGRKDARSPRKLWLRLVKRMPPPSNSNEI